MKSVTVVKDRSKQTLPKRTIPLKWKKGSARQRLLSQRVSQPDQQKSGGDCTMYPCYIHISGKC